MTRRMNLVDNSFENFDLSLDDLYREFAIVIYKGKLYKAFNHQSALEVALNVEGKTLGLNLNNEELLVAEKITYDMRNNEIISTWNWYSNSDTGVEYLIASDLDNFRRDSKLKVIKELNLELGYFITNDKIKLDN